jgi:hypothetical protein
VLAKLAGPVVAQRGSEWLAVIVISRHFQSGRIAAGMVFLCVERQ